MRTTAYATWRRACGTLAKSLPPHKLMPMPRLSPTMTSGTLMRWHVSEGAELPEGGADVLLSVRPVGLTDDPDDGSPILEVESHEEGFLAHILLHEGEDAEPDVAIAVICESEADIGTLHEAYSRDCGVLMVEPATFAWQAYLAAGEVGRACSNS